jgi:hypothetical protein
LLNPAARPTAQATRTQAQSNQPRLVLTVNPARRQPCVSRAKGGMLMLDL